MTSRKFRIVAAVQALVTAGIADAGIIGCEIRGFNSVLGGNAVANGPGGIAAGVAGEASLIEAMMSPPAWTFQLTIKIDLLAPRGSDDAAADVDAMARGIGQRINADRTLGSLADWMEAGVPVDDDVSVREGETQRWASFDIQVEYTTDDPLGG